MRAVYFNGLESRAHRPSGSHPKITYQLCNVVLREGMRSLVPVGKRDRACSDHRPATFLGWNRSAPVPGTSSCALSTGMGQLYARNGSLSHDEVGNWR